jgi:hypothetical protein
VYLEWYWAWYTAFRKRPVRHKETTPAVVELRLEANTKVGQLGDAKLLQASVPGQRPDGWERQRLAEFEHKLVVTLLLSAKGDSGALATTT